MGGAQQEAFRRRLVEMVVERGIREIREDPRRSIRKLVDLGREMAPGQFQQRFLRIAQEMLERDDSPYYQMVQQAVSSVDAERLKTFGVNLGWGSLSVGARRIRAYEAAHGHNVPWSLTLHMAGGGPEAPDYPALLREGTAPGIYTYFLFPEGEAAVAPALALAAREPECDFFLFLPAGYRGEAAPFLPCLNLALCVDTGGAGWEDMSARLRREGLLTLPYCRYETEEDAAALLSGSWMRRVLPHGGPAAICVAGPGCPPERSEAVHRRILEDRLGQRYPLLSVDFYRDCLYADLCISSGACFLGILPDGALTELRDGREVPIGASLRQSALAQVLTRFVKETDP